MLIAILNWLAMAFIYCLAGALILAVIAFIVLLEIEVGKEKEHGTHS